MFLEISQNSQENTCARGSFLIKLQALGIFFNIFFTEHAWATASVFFWNFSDINKIWELKGFYIPLEVINVTFFSK